MSFEWASALQATCDAMDVQRLEASRQEDKKHIMSDVSASTRLAGCMLYARMSVHWPACMQGRWAGYG